MALNLDTEIVSCDQEGCTTDSPLSNSVVQGWWYTINTATEPGQAGRYMDYCPEHAGGKRIKITPPEPEQ